MSSVSPARASHVGLKVALCLAVFAAGWVTGRHPSAKPTVTSAESAKLVVTAPSVESFSTRKVELSNKVELPVKWSQLEAADYPDFIARLRAAGCPELPIRGLVLTDLGRNYGEQIRRLGAETGTGTTVGSPAVARLLAERDGLAWQLLGLDYEVELRTIWPEEFGDLGGASFAHSGAGAALTGPPD